MASSSNKQYGLIIPKKFNINEVKRAAAFDNESDSEDNSTEAGTSDWIKKSFQKQAAQSGGIRRQTEIDMKRALEQDPTVYKYDEIYDDIEKKKAEEDKKKSQTKKPRYIQNLLRTAQQRKLENERRVERQVQKERDAEGEQFKDKETFVTSSYKKKLEEFHKLDEEERRKDMLEEICDVSKQQDLGGFYRHLYRTTVDKDASEIKDEENQASNKKEVENENSIDPVTNLKKCKRENRQYRKRKSSESSSLEEGEHDDSDTSIDSSSSSVASVNSKDNKQKPSKSNKAKDSNNEHRSSKKRKNIVEIKMEELVDSDEEQPSKELVDKNNTTGVVENSKTAADKTSSPEETKVTDSKEEKEIVIKEKIPKINIWEKRTVGEQFDAALERYFKRKSERLANRGN